MGLIVGVACCHGISCLCTAAAAVTSEEPRGDPHPLTNGYHHHRHQDLVVDRTAQVGRVREAGSDSSS